MTVTLPGTAGHIENVPRNACSPSPLANSSVPPCLYCWDMTTTFALLNAGFDTDAVGLLDDAALEDRLTSHAALVAAETAVFLRLLGEFDARGRWQVDGVRSLAHWMNWKLGTSQRTAQEQIRVAKSLRDLPAITTRFEAGEISYSRVRAITRIASKQTEELLLDLATHTTGSQLERVIRLEEQLARNHDADTPPAAPEVVRYTDSDDRSVIAIKGARCDMDLVWKAINEAVTADTERPIEERRSDAAVAIADAYLSSKPADRSGSDRTQVVAHRNADGTTTVNGHLMHPTEASRLTCDATTIDITHHHNCCASEDEIGRNTSGVSESMRRRVLLRDGNQCSWPGCDAQHFLHIHHVVHREHGGRTILSNLAPLCGHHHRILHAHSYRLVRATAGWAAERSDGTVIGPPTVKSVPRNARSRQVFPADAMTSRWDGTPLDLWWYEPIGPGKTVVNPENVPRNAD